MIELRLGFMASISARARVISLPSSPRRTTTFLSCSTTTPVKIAAIGRGDDERRESLADLGAGVDDVQEHGLQVVAAVGGQVGPDLAPLAEEGMTAGTLLVEELLARLGDAGAGADRRRPAGRSARGARPSVAGLIGPKSLVARPAIRESPNSSSLSTTSRGTV